MKNFGIAKSLLLFMIFVQGCGYSTKVFLLPSHIKTVYVETFQNKTDQPNLENDLRIKLIAALQSDGNLSISSSTDADAVLKGEVVGYARQPLRYLNEREVWEYRIGITVNFVFSDQVKKEVYIIENNFGGNADFYLSGPSAKSEDKTKHEALEDLSKRILNRILTAW